MYWFEFLFENGRTKSKPNLVPKLENSKIDKIDLHSPNKPSSEMLKCLVNKKINNKFKNWLK